jgi:hypothetical protein
MQKHDALSRQTQNGPTKSTKMSASCGLEAATMKRQNFSNLAQNQHSHFILMCRAAGTYPHNRAKRGVRLLERNAPEQGGNVN